MDSIPSTIYSRLLFPKGHGYPLYFPEPNEDLPEVYRVLGTRIGDVGIVAEDGSFDYLFNVCRPADHLINLNRTPHDFEYVELCQENDMRTNRGAHAPKSYVASTTVQRTVLGVGASTGERSVCLLVDAVCLITCMQSYSRRHRCLCAVHQFQPERCYGRIIQWCHSLRSSQQKQDS